MEPLSPRALNDCPVGKQWYVCTAGDFHGCCSTDPCTSGVCPDFDPDDNGDSSSPLTELTDLVLTKTAPGPMVPDVPPRTTTTSVAALPESTSADTTASASSPIVSSTSSEIAAGSVAPLPLEETPASETSTPTLPVTSEALDVPTSSDTSIVTGATTGATAASSVLAASNGIASPSSTPSDTPSTASSNLGAIIGGVVGGVGALIICAIIVFCCCRRKKKTGKYSSLAWYPSKARKERATASEMKGPISPSDSEANTSSFSPFTNSTRPNTLLSPDLTLSNSSTTNLSTHSSPSKKPLIPPTPPHTNELFASVPPRQGFTPELPDTGFYRVRAELASHAPSELINLPMERRRQQNIIKNRPGPRSWESPALTPNSQTSQSPPLSIGNSTSTAHSRSQSDSTQPNSQSGRVVTAEGVVLGANLDRYSTGLEIGERVREEREAGGRERGPEHVMSFMQYAERPERDGLGIAMGGQNSGGSAGEESVSRVRRRPVERSLQDEIVAVEGEGDVPPAYEAEEGGSGDLKSPSGRMGMSMRGG
ncbi:uncharacterized protein N7515_008258 [Penicillium bovifimosum]|uniref:Uncharacterized protein n=1 Tax=Penicillium bovifimosum TaxID=126998 RepID=A0A9W9KXN3_9EURO|nr:uncharacterized protein N7515_008258 [Penicillium bovifimosum]KAJ5124433.1 hypothetical protein N7515_008258 [Penicillium bovifimosum]